MSSPKEKTRKTYTRRAPKTKILDVLQELKDLVERHCGESQAVIQQTARAAASEAVAAVLNTSPESPLAYAVPAKAPSPAALPMMPTTARVLVPNPSGPSEWNEFMQEFKAKYEAEARARGNERKKIPYMEVLKAGKEAYQAKKTSQGRTTRRRAPTAKAAPVNVNINAMVAPLTQRLNAANQQRRQLAAKIEVYKTAMPEEAKRLGGLMNQATASRSNLDAAIAALRGKKLSAAATKKAETLIKNASRNFNAQTMKIDEVTRQLDSELETMRAKKASRRVSTLNERGMTPRDEKYFNVLTPIDEEEEGSTGSSTGSSNNSSTGSSNNSSTGSRVSPSPAKANSPSPLLAKAASPNKSSTPSPAKAVSPLAAANNVSPNLKYNNAGPDELGARKVTIKGKKYYLLPDGELVDRGDNSDPDAIGSNIIGMWKNGSIQPYVSSEEPF